jgi:NADPH2 dehydrogenase
VATEYRKMATYKTAEDLRARLAELGTDLPFDDVLSANGSSPLAAPIDFDPHPIGNRFAVLPMEGWDGTLDGRPSELTTTRWRRFGASGAKLIWGGEAVAVRHDGRANPNQLCLTADNVPAIAELREALVDEHERRHGRTDDLLVGLQLTHSGRFARPDPPGTLVPRILYRHPILDARFDLDPSVPVLSDDEIDQLQDDYVTAAHRAHEAGFEFVDIKHCHGYLGHEFLSAYDREGRYGGSFENRTRFLREVITRIQEELPDLRIGVRLSSFDLRPFRPGVDGVGEPATDGSDTYRYAFGGSGDGLSPDPELAEPKAVVALLADLGVRLLCVSAASPYYNPHLMRPATFPPSDGYQPPEDPLVGVARLIHAAGQLKRHSPETIVVGSGYSYLQEWLPHVAQRVVSAGLVDSVGLGRMMLSYPELPADVLAGRPMTRKHICRTFSDCTTAPRNGMVSGCYPLDPAYKGREEAVRLKEVKKAVDL